MAMYDAVSSEFGNLVIREKRRGGGGGGGGGVIMSGNGNASDSDDRGITKKDKSKSGRKGSFTSTSSEPSLWDRPMRSNASPNKSKVDQKYSYVKKL